MSATHLNCGYVPLIDSAPLIIAKELNFAAEEGLELTLTPQPSWSALRDMLALGHLEAAQMLAPMSVAMSMGLGGLSAQIDALMVLSVNGTIIGVSQDMSKAMGDVPFADPTLNAEALLAAAKGKLRVGVPFPFSMHRLLFEYWLSDKAAEAGIEIEIVTTPPPRMADALENGLVDVFCVGEPWGSVAVARGVGRLILPSSAIWQFAPEKVLAVRHEWASENAETCGALMRAIYKAARWLDTGSNKPLAVDILSRSAHLDLPDTVIDPAISNSLSPDMGLPGEHVENFLIFNRHAANFPWRSQAAWIAARLNADAEGIETAKKSFRSDLYRQHLSTIGADMPGASEKLEGSMRHATAVASARGHLILGPDAFFDGKIFDSGQEV